MFLDSAKINSSDISGVMTFGPYDYVPIEELPNPTSVVSDNITQADIGTSSTNIIATADTGISWAPIIGIGILVGLLFR